MTTKGQSVDPETGEIVEATAAGAVAVPTGDIVEYPGLNPDPELMAAILEETGGEIDPSLIGQIVTPRAGSSTFEIPSTEGMTPVKKFEAIILARLEQRAYWAEEFGSGDTNSPPDCSATAASGDTLVGTVRIDEDGEPAATNVGGPCRECPMSQFGSHPKEGDNRQACAASTVLLLLLPGMQMPIKMRVPATSLKNLRSYGMGVISAHGAGTHSVVTTISSEKAKSGGGIDYSKMTFETARALDATAKASALVQRAEGMVASATNAVAIEAVTRREIEA